jgi:hypothetical protein
MTNEAANEQADDVCGECGGRTKLVAVEGRLRRFRGEEGYIVPASMRIATCADCGTQWFSTSQLLELAEYFEVQRALRRERPARVVTTSSSLPESKGVPVPVRSDVGARPCVVSTNAILQRRAVA